MQIRFIPPAETEAKVEIKENGEVVISPRFPSAKSAASIGSVIVKGSKGKERRYILAVSGSQGKVSAFEAKSVEPEFDTKGS